jgi:large subunit ribosomal protein L1
MAKTKNSKPQNQSDLANETVVQEVVVKKSSKSVLAHGKKYLKSRDNFVKYTDAQKEDGGLDAKEAIDLLKANKNAKFVETVELHINTVDQSVKGEVLLPHSTGKIVRIAVADEALLEKLEKSIIDFDILVTTPSMMPKLTKFAKLLGPKGLMPNPKSGTVGSNTTELVQKFSGNTLRYKSEPKAPIIHLVVGKIDRETPALVENINAILKAIDGKNIKSAYLSLTMSPSVRIKV